MKIARPVKIQTPVQIKAPIRGYNASGRINKPGYPEHGMIAGDILNIIHNDTKPTILTTRHTIQKDGSRTIERFDPSSGKPTVKMTFGKNVKTYSDRGRV